MVQLVALPRTDRRGAALASILLVMIVIMSMAGLVLMLNVRAKNEHGSSLDRYRALTTADAGVSHAIRSISAEEFGAIGSEANPVELSMSNYNATIQDLGDGLYQIQSVGRAGREEVALEAVVRFTGADPFDHAIFAGNSEEDPLYTLELGGRGTGGDEVNGNAYSGGDFALNDDAGVNGDIVAAGVINGGSGLEDYTLPVPDLQAMDYANFADHNVNDLFASATRQSNSLGGTAEQVSESNPAHIFRKNPSDRSDELAMTVKDDYFLEDPYERVNGERTVEGYANKISLAGVNGEPGSNGNQAVYYIDGNLWLHNAKSYSFEFDSAGTTGTQVTFVVNGNIYFSDNIYYENQDTDGIAFIAMKDPNVVDSGNIYLGDPRFGTLGRMQSFMYAEQNVFDISLDNTSAIRIDGNITAGEQIMLQRDNLVTNAGGTGSQDWGWWSEGDTDDDDDGWWEEDDDDGGGSSSSGSTSTSTSTSSSSTSFSRTRLTVNYDDRDVRGALPLPGLPRVERVYNVVSWREVAVP